jgi:hypothetical protein
MAHDPDGGVRRAQPVDLRVHLRAPDRQRLPPRPAGGLGAARQAHGAAGEGAGRRQPVGDAPPDAGRVGKAVDEQERHAALPHDILGGAGQQAVGVAREAPLPETAARSDPRGVQQVDAEPSEQDGEQR